MADLKHLEHAVEAAAQAVVDDVVATVRKHPEYANLVNTLTEQAVAALIHGL